MLIFFRFSPFLCHFRRSFRLSPPSHPLREETRLLPSESCLPFHFYRVDEPGLGEGGRWFHRGDRIAKLSARSPDCCGSVGARVVGKSCPWDWSRISNCQFPPSRNRRKLPLCCRKGIGCRRTTGRLVVANTRNSRSNNPDEFNFSVIIRRKADFTPAPHEGATARRKFALLPAKI